MTGQSHNPIDLVDDYVHGLLKGSQHAEVEEFCRETPEGQAALEQARARQAALQSLPMVEAPESLIQQTLAGISQKTERRRRNIRRYFGTLAALTAAFVVIVGGMQLYYGFSSPPRYDIRLVGQAQLLAGSPAALRLEVFNMRARPQQPAQQNAALVGQVPVRLLLADPATGREVELVSAETDESGGFAPAFEVPDWETGDYELRVLTGSGSGANADGQLVRTVRIERASRVMLSTDKPVYQPGQTIHMRALGLRQPDGKPVADEPAELTITDPKGNLIFRHNGKSSRFGLTSADCPLAREITEGSYRIACRVGETETAVAVDVRRYVLPKFKVALTLDKEWYTPGEEATGSIQADYFFGQPVISGTVELHLEGGFLQGPNPLDTFRTDETGRGEFDFRLPTTLPGRGRIAGEHRLELVAHVTDSAGQVQTVSASRPVTNNPIRITVLPEASRLVQDVTNRISLFTTYADGRPAPARLKVSGVEEELQTSELGVARFELKPKEREVGLTIRATDAAGLIGRRHVKLSTGTLAEDFLLRTDQAVFRAGETVNITVLASGTQPVLLDLLRDGQTLTTQSIPVENGEGRHTFDLPPELFGTTRLVAYRFNSAGISVMKTRTLFIHPPQDLQLKATLDRETYHPGETAKLSFQLTDADGNPTVGAVSLAAVDEAVFHVLKQRPGLESTFFALEQELLQPVYRIYPWSPRLPGNDSPPVANPADIYRNELARATTPEAAWQELEAALFSQTWQDVTPGSLAFNGAAEYFDRHSSGELTDVVAEDSAPQQSGRDRGEAAIDAPLPAVTSPVTLRASSYEESLSQWKQWRRSNLRWLAGAWGVFMPTLILMTVVGLVYFNPHPLLITGVGLVLLLIVVSLITPGVKSARNGVEFAAGTAVEFDMAAGAEAMQEPVFEFSGVVDIAETTNLVAGTASLAYSTSGQVSSSSPEAKPAIPVRVRRSFPETLLWRPELITDEQGRLQVDVQLADSITTWQLSASAVSAAGRLGATQQPIQVFQPFFVDLNLPVALTRNDEVTVPIVVYNYLDQPQTVELTINRDEWYEPLGDQQENVLQVELQPREVRSLQYPLKAVKVGRHMLEVTARAGEAADALRKEVTVDSDGLKVEQVASGSLDDPATLELQVPADAIEGSVSAVLKLYPSRFSELLEGMEGIFQRPSGCFEQTSSTTYPNVLALDYLKRTGQQLPEVEAQARQYIHLGWQKLISFEVAGGGFDWFGNPPANVTLTAYGLMEFQDMARVYDVDPEVLARTREWLLSRRRPDGHWPADRGMLNDGLAGAVQRGDNLDLVSTAYVAWAVFGDRQQHENVDRRAEVTIDYLLAHPVGQIDDPYTLALMANALAAIDSQNDSALPYVERLEQLKQTSPDGKQHWWAPPASTTTTFYGAGQTASIETTALTVLAMQAAGGHSATVGKSLAWLFAQRDSSGTWGSTQATVLALKAAINGGGPAEPAERTIELVFNGGEPRTIRIAADQADVMQQLSLTGQLQPGTNTLALRELTETGLSFQLSTSHYVPTAAGQTPGDGPLSIELAFDRNRLNIDESITGTAVMRNQLDATIPMVMVDLPIPPGFQADAAEFSELVAQRTIAKFDLTARSVIVYLRELAPGEPLTLSYRLRATSPVKAQARPAVVYDYYNPTRRQQTEPVLLTVLAAGTGNAGSKEADNRKAPVAAPRPE